MKKFNGFLGYVPLMVVQFITQFKIMSFLVRHLFSYSFYMQKKC